MQPETILQKLIQHIREEFEEAPGLALTVPEAARFWGIDELTCEQILGRLRTIGFLTRDGERRYRQAPPVRLEQHA
jgi:hypothetical protein